MATDPTLLHQLSLLLQSKRRDAKRKGGERCREKGRGREEMHKEGGKGRLLLCLGMQRAKFKL
jgi:hypothetical protein